MTDTCSDLAYKALKAKGKVGHDQLSVLNVFRKMRIPLTGREAYEAAKADGINIDFIAFRARVTELTEEEYGNQYLEKLDKQICRVTGRLVNRWRVRGLPVVEKQGELF